MRTVATVPPSFPNAPANALLTPADGLRWQVLCGDAGRWRAGVYSPPEASRDEVRELEQHDCPELFLLIRGRLTLVLFEAGQVRELALVAGRPTLVTAPHGAYCPDGPGTGAAFVIERDAFDTEYREIAEWQP